MKGRESIRGFRIFLLSSGVRSRRGVVDACVTSAAPLRQLCSDRAPTVDADCQNFLTSLWKNDRTSMVADKGLSSINLSSVARSGDITHEQLTGDLTSQSAYTCSALQYFRGIRVVNATGVADSWKIWLHSQTPNSYSQNGCGPRMSASFATIRVKDEEEGDSKEHDARASEKFKDQVLITQAPKERASSSKAELTPGPKPISIPEKNSNPSNVEFRGNLGWSDAGWTREEVFNWPNSISMARLLSGPALAWMILQDLWSPALIGLIIAGISDWLDGYVARRMKINSVLGSYLDPVADKVLVGSVALSMAYTGLLHPALVGLVVARDGVLVGGAFVYRAYSLRWQWKNWREFFRINVGGAGKVEPLFISKVNTVLQLGLIGVALLQPALSIEDTYSLVPLLSWSVVGTTSISWVCYVYKYLKNPEALAALSYVRPTSGDNKSSDTPDPAKPK